MENENNPETPVRHPLGVDITKDQADRMCEKFEQDLNEGAGAYFDLTTEGVK